jgi:hypothetical protein
VAPDGDVLVVDRSVDALEQVRERSMAPNVFYLVGSMDVLPLTDASVDRILTGKTPSSDAATEFFRVLRSSGQVALAIEDQDLTGAALNIDGREIERLFTDAGFTAVKVAAAQGRLSVAARKP